MSDSNSASVQLLLQTVATQAQTIQTQAETISRMLGEQEPEMGEAESRPAPTSYMDGTPVR